ncbi:RNA/RNP complex-1-interacting phosphatase homolog isoform X2 [Clytia hemisphaerica]|uniref:RNA/RNP complex-1-interacting phosphatase n=1 Tax=Clytia hemisphaerica TaxID=252671 RepID=A0A7M5V813_9CNID
MGSRIPERWLDYNAINEPIEGAPIIAFKTPLSDRYNRPEDNTDEEATFVEKDKEFTPSQLVAKVEEKDLELSVVVDITFTFRYYNGVHEFENKHNIQYDKIKCPGQQIPPDEIINRFATIMNDFISENGLDGKKLVGLHCTHGVNRSGYVLARYLIEWLNFEPEKAIEAVGKARGYPIERENYLQDLKERKARKGYEQWKNGEDFITDKSLYNSDGNFQNDNYDSTRPLQQQEHHVRDDWDRNFRPPNKDGRRDYYDNYYDNRDDRNRHHYHRGRQHNNNYRYRDDDYKRHREYRRSQRDNQTFQSDNYDDYSQNNDDSKRTSRAPRW